MEKTVKILTAALLLLALILIGVICGSHLFYGQDGSGNRIFAGKKIKNLLDEDLTVSQFEEISRQYPGRKILWNVPFQQRHYASNTEKITITSLNMEDVKRLQYLTDLSFVDAKNCFDYEALNALRLAKPQCRLDYEVVLDGKFYPMDTESLEFERGEEDYKELMQRLICLPELKQVTFRNPDLTAQELKTLVEQYPQVHFEWEKELFGRTISSETEDLDISGIKFTSVEEVEKQTDFLPNLKMLLMCDTGLPYEDIAEFRDRSRDRFKVVFNVIIKNLDVRTDIVRFAPREFSSAVSDCDTRYLVYCEDLVSVDLSNCVVRNIDWARGTPHLQYLIIKNSPFRDLQPLRYLKELKLLELSKLDLRDLRPLEDCTALEDLKITGGFPKIHVLQNMTWLKHLWVPGEKANLRKLLPHTEVHGSLEPGWEKLPNYQQMKMLKDPHVPVVLEHPPVKEITPGFVIPKA